MINLRYFIIKVWGKSDVFRFQTFAFLISLLSLRSPIYDIHIKLSTNDPPPQFHHLQKWNLLIKKGGIRKHLAIFKNSAHTPFLYSRHKCMFPFWFFKIWSITCLNANEVLSFMKIQSDYLLLTYQRNQAYFSHCISYFLKNLLILCH